MIVVFWMDHEAAADGAAQARAFAQDALAQARRFRFRRFAAAATAIDWLLTPRRQRQSVRREPSAKEVLTDLRLGAARC